VKPGPVRVNPRDAGPGPHFGRSSNEPYLPDAARTCARNILRWSRFPEVVQGRRSRQISSQAQHGGLGPFRLESPTGQRNGRRTAVYSRPKRARNHLWRALDLPPPPLARPKFSTPGAGAAVARGPCSWLGGLPLGDHRPAPQRLSIESLRCAGRCCGYQAAQRVVRCRREVAGLVGQPAGSHSALASASACSSGR